MILEHKKMSKNFKIKNKIWENRFEIVIILILFFSLSYCLNGTYNFDDAIGYYFRGQFYVNDINIIDVIRDAEKSWFMLGRFFPLNIMFEIFFYYILYDYIIYELFIIFFIIGDVLLFGSLIYEITNCKRTKLLGMLFIIVFFQVYSTYHNAIIGYGALLQICLLFLLFELKYFIKFLKYHKKKYLIISCFFQLLGVIWYEVGYINMVFLFILYFFYNKDKITLKKLKEFILICLPTICCVVITICLRLCSQNNYVGTSISFNIIAIIKTLLVQLFAVLPLSHFITQNKNGIINFNYINFIDIIIVVMYISCFWFINRSFKSKHIKPNILYGILSLAGYILPGSLITLTEKYQNELSYGVAHISVFIQYFGLCAFLLWTFLWFEYLFSYKIKTQFMKLIKSIIVLLLGCILLINLAVTKSNINTYNNILKYPKEAVISAIEKGLLNDFDDNDIIVSIKSYPWDNENFYSQFAKKKITSVSYNDLQTNFDNYKDKNIYFINYTGTNSSNAVIMCKANNISFTEDNSMIESIISDTFIMYVKGDINILYDEQQLDIEKNVIKKTGTKTFEFLNLQFR